jgi:hypothetical protein
VPACTAGDQTSGAGGSEPDCGTAVADARAAASVTHRTAADGTGAPRIERS